MVVICKQIPSAIPRRPILTEESQMRKQKRRSQSEQHCKAGGKGSSRCLSYKLGNKSRRKKRSSGDPASNPRWDREAGLESGQSPVEQAPSGGPTGGEYRESISERKSILHWTWGALLPFKFISLFKVWITFLCKGRYFDSFLLTIIMKMYTCGTVDKHTVSETAGSVPKTESLVLVTT